MKYLWYLFWDLADLMEFLSKRAKDKNVVTAFLSSVMFYLCVPLAALLLLVLWEPSS
jgi:hypothetical protein